MIASKIVKNVKNATRKSSVYVSGVHTKELGGKQLIMDPSTNQGMAFNTLRPDRVF